MAGPLRLAAPLLLLASALEAAVGGAGREAGARLGDRVSLLQSSSVLSGQSEDDAGRGDRVAQRTLNAVVDLDLPPEDRWYSFYAANREAVMEHFEHLMVHAEKFSAYFKHYDNATKLAELRKGVVENLHLEPHQDMLAEYRGIARALDDPRITPEAMLWLDMSYERGVAWGCTSLLATAADGEVFHGRNLDLSEGPLFTPYLLDVTYTRGGKPFAVSTNMILTVGAHTAYRIGAWSLSTNVRDGVQNQTASVLAAQRGARPMAFFTRHLLDFAPDFEAAVQAAAQSYLVSPQYIVIAGKGAYEGAVITRDREGRSAPYSNVMALSPAIGRWFIVQTNDDVARWPKDKRRPTGIRLLEQLQQQQVNQSSILDIMMTEPVHNEGTIFTWVVQPRNGARRMVLGGDKSWREAAGTAAAV